MIRANCQPAKLKPFGKYYLMAIGMLFANVAHAETYKCVDGGRTSFQEQPCKGSGVVPKVRPRSGDVRSAIASFQSPDEVRNWIRAYAMQPEPSRFPEAIRYLTDHDLLGKADASLIRELDGFGPGQFMTGFIAGVYRKNPNSINKWMKDFQSFPEKDFMIILGGLVVSEIPGAQEAAIEWRKKYFSKDGAEKDKFLKGLRIEKNYEGTPWYRLLAGVQWGIFLATGDKTALLNVLDTAKWLDGGDHDLAMFAFGTLGTLTEVAQKNHLAIQLLLAERENLPPESAKLLNFSPKEIRDAVTSDLKRIALEDEKKRIDKQPLSKGKNRSPSKHLASRQYFSDCETCPAMVVIPPGKFVMGSPETENFQTERPAHVVTISRFALAKTEITYSQWRACYKDGGCRTESGYFQMKVPEEFANRPVAPLTWVNAQEYVRWLRKKTGLDYRLPSEAEWEYAARGGTTTTFYTGECIHTDQANYAGSYSDYHDCGAKTGFGLKSAADVASYPPNKFNLYDMFGNVSEWVDDCWHPNYIDAPTTGVAWRSENNGDCNARVIRGGSGEDSAFALRSAYRTSTEIDKIGSNWSLGFRVARDL